MVVKSLAAYRQNRVIGASPVGLVVILLREAMRRIDAGRKALRAGQLEEAHRQLIRAQDIVYELRGAVNRDAGPIADNLIQLYDFVLRGLVDANIKKREDGLDALLEVLATLTSAWQELECSHASVQA